MRTITILAVALLAACSSESPAPTSPDAANKSALNGGASRGSSDTTATPPYAGTVHIAGRVLGVARVAPASPGADTLGATPIAGATLTLYHNVLVNGAGQSVLVGQVVTRADGSYEFPDVPGGYYLLRGSVSDGPWAGSSSLDYVAANAARITVDVRFWQRS
jgi:hypothetical protein